MRPYSALSPTPPAPAQVLEQLAGQEKPPFKVEQDSDGRLYIDDLDDAQIMRSADLPGTPDLWLSLATVTGRHWLENQSHLWEPAVVMMLPSWHFLRMHRMERRWSAAPALPR